MLVMPTGINHILLIWPKMTKDFIDLNHLSKIFGNKGSFFPLPLLYVASALGAEWEYKIVDENIRGITHKEKTWADFFLISSNSFQKKAVENLIPKLKEFNKPIIIGGTVFYEDIEAFARYDIIRVIGEIESIEKTTSDQHQTIAEKLCNDMKVNSLKPLYLAWENSYRVQNNPPRYDLIKPHQYSYFSIETSRFSSKDKELNTLKYHRRKPINQIMLELDMLLKIGTHRSVLLVDDDFTGDLNKPDNKEYLKELFNECFLWQKKNNFPFDFTFKSSIEVGAHADILQLMSLAGFNIVFIKILIKGSESLDSTNPDDERNTSNLTTIANLQKFGIGIIGELAIDFNNDVDIDSAINFIKESSIPYFGISFHEQIVSKKNTFQKKEELILFDYNTFINSLRTKIISPKYPLKLYTNFSKLVLTLFNAKEYFSRSISWTQKWNDEFVISGMQGSISPILSYMRIIRSMVIQGILSNYRILYWRSLVLSFKNFRKKPTKLALSLYLIYFYSIIYDIIKEIQKKSFSSDATQYIK